MVPNLWTPWKGLVLFAESQEGKGEDRTSQWAGAGELSCWSHPYRKRTIKSGSSLFLTQRYYFRAFPIEYYDTSEMYMGYTIFPEVKVRNNAGLFWGESKFWTRIEVVRRQPRILNPLVNSLEVQAISNIKSLLRALWYHFVIVLLT